MIPNTSSLDDNTIILLYYMYQNTLKCVHGYSAEKLSAEYSKIQDHV